MRRLYRAIMICCVLAFLGAIVYIGIYIYDSKSSARYNQEIQEEAYIAPSFSDSAKKEQAPLNEQESEIKSKKVIDFAKLYRRNNDILAWLSISGTGIDYPVMYTPDKETFYLHKNYDREKDAHGTLFLAKNCVPGSKDSNLLIYGHNMKDGSMFADLIKYKDETFYQKHKLVNLYTKDCNYQYEVTAVFQTDVSENNNDTFLYSQYTDLSESDRFKKFQNNVQKRQLYKTGEELIYGEPLLMLSTCEYSSKNGRLVVVCQRVDEKTIQEEK